jgi:hypothetical protein
MIILFSPNHGPIIPPGRVVKSCPIIDQPGAFGAQAGVAPVGEGGEGVEDLEQEAPEKVVWLRMRPFSMATVTERR